jgi:hypothetical protein
MLPTTKGRLLIVDGDTSELQVGDTVIPIHLRVIDSSEPRQAGSREASAKMPAAASRQDAGRATVSGVWSDPLSCWLPLHGPAVGVCLYCLWLVGAASA